MRLMRDKRRRNNRGETMVETLVSFVILAIVMLALGGMVFFSAHLRMRAEDVAKVSASFYQEIYKDNPDSTKVTTSYYMGKHASDNKTMFYLQLSDKTSNANLGVSTDAGRLVFQTKPVRIPNIDARGFRSEDPMIDDENLVRPRVLMFSYNRAPFSTPGSGGN